MGKSMETDLRERIAEEASQRRGVTGEEVYEYIGEGRIIEAAGNLLFHTDPVEFDGKLEALLAKIEAGFPEAKSGQREKMLLFLCKLTVDLYSFLPHWVLLNKLDVKAIDGAAGKSSDLLEKLGGMDGEAAAKVRAGIYRQTAARLRAEGIGEEAELGNRAEALLGKTLPEYCSNLGGEIKGSNLFEITRRRLEGEHRSELGNDYASFLQYVIWLGGSFVTTNPVLIKVAWDTDPGLWNGRIDDLILSRYSRGELKSLLQGTEEDLEKAVTAVNSLVTMSVVEENCRLLRDIFLVTGGREGYVSLQVNPKNHDDSRRMVEEAGELYADLEARFGGVPNVVFKLPATAAGLSAAEALTSKGIGVTITVCFSVFQALGFGEVLSRGNALVTYIALMNGRMAYPVRDELKEKGTPRGEEAARWAGVEVARKSFSGLYGSAEEGGRGVDPGRVKLLIASLRIYDDWLPDISELWGCPVITIFPNVRRKFDDHPRDFRAGSVLDNTPGQDKQLLMNSEIFRQAWWMPGYHGVPGDSDGYKPERVLTLLERDSSDLARWKPVADTLGQFIDLYDQMGRTVRDRMESLVS